MHEAALAQMIVEKASNRAATVNGIEAVDRIYLRVGEFRNVDPESLTFAFDSIKSLYLLCNNARLVIDMVKPLALCENHHTYSAQPSLDYRCPNCYGGVRKFLSGEELEIIGIDFVRNDEEMSNARISK